MQSVLRQILELVVIFSIKPSSAGTC